MRRLSGSLGFLLWFVLVIAGCLHLMYKGNQVDPELRVRAQLLSALERSIVAVRECARHGEIVPKKIEESLLALGIQSRLLAPRDEILRCSIRLSPDVEGELAVYDGASGRRVVRAATGQASGWIELRALVRPSAVR